MPLQNMTDLLVSQLSDMYSAETQLTQALPKMAHVKLTNIAEAEVNVAAASASGAGR